MKNSTIAQRRAELSNNTVNNNTSEVTNMTNMTNIKSVEIVVNIMLSAQGASTGYFQKLEDSKYKKLLMRGRSDSYFWAAGEGETIFADFAPLPKQRIDEKYSRNNTAVVIFHMEDGSTKILDAVQTEMFWADILQLEEGQNVSEIPFRSTVDIPGYTADKAKSLFRNNTARALSIKFDGIPSFSVGQNTKRKEPCWILRPQNAKVEFTRNTVDCEGHSLKATNLSKVLNVSSTGTFKFDAKSITKSTAKRNARRAQAAAARQSFDTVSVKEEPTVFNFGGSTVVSTAEETPATSVVETPVVAEAPAQSSTDAKLDAIMAMVGNLQTQVSELKAENAELREVIKAKDEHIKSLNTQAAQAQPVAEPTPVVEEVTPEPEVVEEEPAVEETVEEEVTKAPVAEETPVQRARRRAAERKARKAAGNSGFSADDLLNAFE